MRLYLVRHGKAELGPEPSDRLLSTRGHADVEALARHLAAQDLTDQGTPSQGRAAPRFFHSTLTRARQTAEILASHMAPDSPLEQLANIEPWGDVHAFQALVAAWAADDGPDTWVVGHEPFMGEAAALLVTGNPDARLLEVKTGTVMALGSSLFGPRWRLRWMLTPRIVRGPKTVTDET